MHHIDQALERALIHAVKQSVSQIHGLSRSIRYDSRSFLLRGLRNAAMEVTGYEITEIAMQSLCFPVD
jgi:hypothetical protein